MPNLIMTDKDIHGTSVTGSRKWRQFRECETLDKLKSFTLTIHRIENKKLSIFLQIIKGQVNFFVCVFKVLILLCSFFVLFLM